MATSVLGLKTFSASDPVDYNEVNDNYTKIDNGVKTAMQGRAAKNWLDNSDMTNVINQRVATSYTGQVYGIDRWYGRAIAQTVNVRSTDLTVTATGTAYVGIKQKVENIAKLAGKTVTFAVKLYASVDADIRFSDASEGILAYTWCPALTTTTAVLTYTVPSDATADNVIPTIMLRTVATGDYMRIVWAALYEGSYTAETLPAYVPKGYAAELAECQRYYQIIPFDFSMYNVAVDSSYPSRYQITFPQEMRIAPTVSYTESWTSNIKSYESGYVSKKALTFNVSANSNGYTEWHGSIALSADL